MTTEINYHRASDLPSSHLPFSAATSVDNMLFVSGQASVDPSGKIIEDTFEGEFRRSMENLTTILEASGSSLDNVVQVRAYVDDPKDLQEFNRLYRDYFSEPHPARTTLLNCFGGLLKFEIDCVALRTNPS